MKRPYATLLAAALLVGIVLVLFGDGRWRFQSGGRGDVPQPETQSSEPAKGPIRTATLYCEFTNFADQTPLVGFYFLIEDDKNPPAFAQIFRREKDGSQENFGSGSTARPQWAIDSSEAAPFLQSPEDETRINLYGYDPHDSAGRWFEAGLRSYRYKNLGGKCRRGAA